MVGRYITLTTYNLFYTLQQTIVSSRGVLCVARDKGRPVMLEFTAFKDNDVFDKKTNIKDKKEKIRRKIWIKNLLIML